MSDEFNDAHETGYRAGLEYAIQQIAIATETAQRTSIDPCEQVAAALADEIEAHTPANPVSVGPLPEGDA